MRLPKRVTDWLYNRADRLMDRRSPDVLIGGADNPYMARWYVIPRNRFLNVYLHYVMRDDDDRACHDHPWSSVSVCLMGAIREIIETRHEHGLAGYHPEWIEVRRTERLIEAGDVVRRSAWLTHRLTLPGGFPAMTLFITGPRVRSWYFWCNDGRRPVHWKDFTQASTTGDGTKVGRGCE